MNFWKKKEESEAEQGESSSQRPSASTHARTSGRTPDTDSSTKTAEPAVLTSSASRSVDTGATSSTASGSLEDRFGKVRSALGVGTVIQGKLSFDTPVSIDGKLSGEIFSSKELIVGKSGEIDAEVDVACLVIRGQVKGKIRASERIEIWSGGNLEGDIQTPSLIIEEGARFNGACSMDPGSKGVVKSTAVADQSKGKKDSTKKEEESEKELRVH